jgi:hypothetical protein
VLLVIGFGSLAWASHSRPPASLARA